jgi:hypothetical protein
MSSGERSGFYDFNLVRGVHVFGIYRGAVLRLY